MLRRKEIALVTAGILTGIAVSGPAAQAAAGLMANPSNQKFYLDDQRISLTAYEIGGSNYVKLSVVSRAVCGWLCGQSRSPHMLTAGKSSGFSRGELHHCLQRETVHHFYGNQ